MRSVASLRKRRRFARLGQGAEIVGVAIVRGGEVLIAATRQARAKWNGDLATGTGEVTAVTTGKFTSLPVSWGSRTESGPSRCRSRWPGYCTGRPTSC